MQSVGRSPIHCTGLLGRELEPTGCRHRQSNKFSDNSTETAERELFLQRREDIFLFVCFDKDDAAVMETGLRQSWKEQVRPCQTLDDFAFGSCCYTGSKKGCSGTIDRASSTARKFVDCTVAQASAWQAIVNVIQTERQYNFPS